MKKNLILTNLFFLLISALFSQVEYHTITPKINGVDSPTLDINHDGTIDITLEYYFDYTGTDIFSIRCGDNVEVCSLNDSLIALNYGDEINENLNWLSDHYSYLLTHHYLSEFTGGHWKNTQIGFLPIRIKNGESWNYSWVRIGTYKEYYDVGLYNHRVFILDYALELTPNEGIIAGQIINEGASCIYAEYVGENYNVRDIQISFVKAKNENNFSEYRVFIAEEDDPNVANLEYLNQLSQDRFMSINIIENDSVFFFDDFLSADLKDINGNELQTITPYRVNILNVSSSGEPNDNLISEPSQLIILEDELKTIQNVQAIDLSDNNDASDVKIVFELPNDNPYTDHYRVFIVPEESIINFETEDALALSEDYYTIIEANQIAPITLNDSQLDVEGFAIQNGVFYKAIALSVADSVHSITPKLSDPSRRFVLETPSAFFAGQKEGAGIQWFPYDTILSITDKWDGIVDDGAPSGNGYSYIDLNRDGIDDFHLRRWDVFSPNGHGEGYEIICLNDNKVLKSSFVEDKWVDVLYEGDIINEYFSFISGEVLLCSYGYSSNPYSSGSNGHLPVDLTGIQFYIGFQLNSSNGMQYAWLKLDGDNFVEYGIQDPLNGIDYIRKDGQYNVYPIPAMDYINIENQTNVSDLDGIIRIINNTGQVVYEEAINSMNHKISVSHLKHGLYYLQILESGKSIETHKILVQ